MDNTTLTDDLIAEIDPQRKGKTIHHEGRMYYPAEMVNRLIAELRSMRAENAHLASWKAGHMEVMSPVLDYARSLKVAPLGGSVTHALIEDHKALRADAERYRGMRAIVMKSTGMAEDDYNSRADDVIALDAARQATK